MRQQKFNSNSTLPKGCGCLLLAVVGVIGPIALLFSPPLFFYFGIKDKQVEISVGGSFFRWTINSKQSEAKQYVSSMNRAQQAYFAENSAFSNYITALGIGIKTETNNYKYSTHATQTAAFNYAVAKDKIFKDYVGGIFLVPAKELNPSADRNEMMTVAILCETEKRQRPWFRIKRTDDPDKPAEPTYQNGEVICGTGTTEVTK
ncbi:MAG: general secretion pathway protein GspH [Oscillatoriaceae cyanobacterium Prado104]|jgi:type II secretory pathway pseudopilin PulG|nr:general secretion pathway protein GspH [Oscillatoriaceae cyanobacterium Prado104]